MKQDWIKHVPCGCQGSVLKTSKQFNTSAYNTQKCFYIKMLLPKSYTLKFILFDCKN